MSDYKITFSPELNISAADFADSWNTLEQCRTVAEADTETAAQQDFNLGEILIMASLSFIGGVSVDLLKDLIDLLRPYKTISLRDKSSKAPHRLQEYHHINQ